jgi:hypothetical protein
MERIVRISKSFEEADDWEIEQQIRMSPNERIIIAKTLRDRFYGTNTKDVRECTKIRPKDLDDLRYLERKRDS